MKILKKQNFFGIFLQSALHGNTHQVSVTLSHLGRMLFFVHFVVFFHALTQHNAVVKLKKIFEL